MQLDHMTDRDLLIQIATEQHHLREELAGVKEHQKETNGHITDIRRDQFIQDGAIRMLRWISSFTLAGVGAGSAVAMVVLAIVSGGI